MECAGKCCLPARKTCDLARKSCRCTRRFLGTLRVDCSGRCSFVTRSLRADRLPGCCVAVLKLNVFGRVRRICGSFRLSLLDRRWVHNNGANFGFKAFIGHSLYDAADSPAVQVVEH